MTESHPTPPTSPAPISETAMRRLAELHDGGTDGGRPAGSARPFFTSDLSVNEFLLVREAGFRPLGLVLGSSIYHVGLQRGRWSRSQELEVLSQAMYHARELAMGRMEAEAQALGADGVVGMRLEIDFKRFGTHLAEFIATGTAVVADAPPPHGDGWLTNRGLPFTSNLSGQDFWTLIQSGYAPVGLVMGTCVYHVARTATTNLVRTFGQNLEIDTFTQALYEARELAMSRMQAEGIALAADGIVGVQLDHLAHGWGDHTTEFLAVGTAVRSLRDDHTITTPTLVIPLS